MHRDPSGMLLCMHENGGPFGEFWGVGGHATAEHTIRPQEKGLLSNICKICFSPPSSLSPTLPLLGVGFSILLHFPTM